MKAVNKFKALLNRKTPTIQVVDANQTVEPEQQKGTTNDALSYEKTSILSNNISPMSPLQQSSSHENATVRSVIAVKSSTHNAEKSNAHTVPHRESPDSEKGHAHDPLDMEPLYLGIGAGGQDNSSVPMEDVCVAESPTAADFDIYDTAYQEEVERIRAAQGHQATIYLTRRVEKSTADSSDTARGGGLWDRIRTSVNPSSQTASDIAVKAMEDSKTFGRGLGEE